MTTHITNIIEKFVRLEPDFDVNSHFIELLDGSRTNGLITAKDDELMDIVDSVCPVFVQRLFIQDVFVQSISSNPTRLG